MFHHLGPRALVAQSLFHNSRFEVFFVVMVGRTVDDFVASEEGGAAEVDADGASVEVDVMAAGELDAAGAVDVSADSSACSLAIGTGKPAGAGACTRGPKNLSRTGPAARMATIPAAITMDCGRECLGDPSTALAPTVRTACNEDER